MKILIFGSGSIGTFLGTKLFVKGHDVNLLGRRKLKTLTHKTITINGQVYPLPPRIYQLTQEQYQLVLVTTKLYDVQIAIQTIQEAQLNPQILAFIQNGLIEPRLYGQVLNAPSFVPVCVFNGYNLHLDQLLVSEHQKGFQIQNNCAGKQLCQLFNSAGIVSFLNPNLPQIKAQKFMANVALNALCALEKKTIGDLVTDPKLKEIVDHLISESWQVLAQDYQLPALSIIQDEIYQLIFQIKNHYSSMYQDLISGRQTEIEFLNGTIIQLAENQGIPTPFNQQIYHQIKTLENLPILSKSIHTPHLTTHQTIDSLRSNSSAVVKY